MNKVELIGRLTVNPELKYTESGKAYTRFTLAVNRKFKKNEEAKDADFIPIVAWEKRAEIICQYVLKGNRLGIVGRIQTGTYDKPDGSKGYTYDVIVEDLEFLENKKNEYNSLEYFLDIHRDSVNGNITTTEINGVKYAKVMFVLGLENEDDMEEMQELITQLGLSGIGGKRSSGYGKFELGEDYIELDENADHIDKISGSNYYKVVCEYEDGIVTKIIVTEKN